LILLPAHEGFKSWQSLTLPLGLIDPSALRLYTSWLFDHHVNGECDTIPGCGFPARTARFKFVMKSAAGAFHAALAREVRQAHEMIRTGGPQYRQYIAASILPVVQPTIARMEGQPDAAYVDPDQPGEIFLPADAMDDAPGAPIADSYAGGASSSSSSSSAVPIGGAPSALPPVYPAVDAVVSSSSAGVSNSVELMHINRAVSR
jgi:hypothetical protein